MKTRARKTRITPRGVFLAFVLLMLPFRAMAGGGVDLGDWEWMETVVNVVLNIFHLVVIIWLVFSVSAAGIAKMRGDGSAAWNHFTNAGLAALALPVADWLLSNFGNPLYEPAMIFSDPDL